MNHEIHFLLQTPHHQLALRHNLLTQQVCLCAQSSRPRGQRRHFVGDTELKLGELARSEFGLGLSAQDLARALIKDRHLEFKVRSYSPHAIGVVFPGGAHIDGPQIAIMTR